MLVRSIGTSLVKQQSRAASLPLLTAGKGIFSCSVIDTQTTDSPASNSNIRPLSTMPHHLARYGDRTVTSRWNLKSTKVPRPITMIPLKNNKPKKKNQLKDRIELDNNISIRKKMKEEQLQESHLQYAGNAKLPITSELKIVMPEDDTPRGIWPVFRMMVRIIYMHEIVYITCCLLCKCLIFCLSILLQSQDESGNFRQADDVHHTNSTKIIPEKHNLSQLSSSLMLQYPHFAEQFQTSTLLQPSKNEYADTLSTNTLLRAHRQMIRLRTMDHILHNAQRQGRISFYMTHHGEEAIQMGSASALQPQDFIFAQYREAGPLMWRGFTLDQFCNQCFSNDMDLGKGRQMPVHYGCRALNYQTVSSPLGTQITQAVGAAYKFKLDALAHPEK